MIVYNSCFQDVAGTRKSDSISVFKEKAICILAGYTRNVST